MDRLDGDRPGGRRHPYHAGAAADTTGFGWDGGADVRRHARHPKSCSAFFQTLSERVWSGNVKGFLGGPAAGLERTSAPSR